MGAGVKNLGASTRSPKQGVPSKSTACCVAEGVEKETWYSIVVWKFGCLLRLGDDLCEIHGVFGLWCMVPLFLFLFCRQRGEEGKPKVVCNEVAVFYVFMGEWFIGALICGAFSLFPVTVEGPNGRWGCCEPQRPVSHDIT